MICVPKRRRGGGRPVITFLILGLFCLLLAASVPVAAAMIMASLAVLLYLGEIPLLVIPQFMVEGITKFELLAVPFFILAAEIMNASGITERIFRAALVIAGGVRGGLAQVNVIASVIFAGISGAAVADAAGLGRVEYKAMTDNDYEPGFSAAVTLASCIIGPLVPPSVILILFAVTAEVSVGRMLLAGFFPGLVVAAVLMIYIYWLVKSGRVVCPVVEPRPWRERGRDLWEALPALFAPLIIVGGIVSGIVTVTEAGVAACAYSLLVAVFVYRQLTWKRVVTLMVRATLSTAMVMLLIGAGTVMAWIITWEQSAVATAEWFTGLTDQLWLQLLMINVFLLIVGCLIEGVPALLILVPVMMPVIENLGIEPVHFGVILILNLLIGIITPPMGLGLFIMSSVTGLPVEEVTRASVKFLPPLLVALGVVTYVPIVSLYLPSVLLP